jgi:myosin heavy subunit
LFIVLCLLSDFKGDPVGGRISQFLLEKSRVVGQLNDERSFHIFYLMLDGVSAAQRHSLQLLSSASEYSYLNKNQCYKVDRMNDKEEWGLTLEGMQAIGMNDEEVDSILRILSAILWLGQLEFAADGADKSKIVDSRPIEVVASLLGCDAKLLAQGMSARTYSANNSSVLTPLNAEQATYTREAFAKAIYFRLFDFIVSRINEAIKTSGAPGATSASSSSSSKTKSVRTIGVLDVRSRKHNVRDRQCRLVLLTTLTTCLFLPSALVVRSTVSKSFSPTASNNSASTSSMRSDSKLH